MYIYKCNCVRSAVGVKQKITAIIIPLNQFSLDFLLFFFLLLLTPGAISMYVCQVRRRPIENASSIYNTRAFIREYTYIHSEMHYRRQSRQVCQSQPWKCQFVQQAASSSSSSSSICSTERESLLERANEARDLVSQLAWRIYISICCAHSRECSSLRSFDAFKVVGDLLLHYRLYKHFHIAYFGSMTRLILIDLFTLSTQHLVINIEMASALYIYFMHIDYNVYIYRERRHARVLFFFFFPQTYVCV